MRDNIFTKLMNLIDEATYAAAVTALAVVSMAAFSCLMAWVFWVLR